VGVDLFERLDVVVLDESAKLGKGSPGLLVSSTFKSTFAKATFFSAAGTTTTATASTITKAASLSATFTFAHLSI